MANTLTNLLPSMYAALDKVSRELVGFIPAVTRDSQAARAAINQTVYVPIAPAVTTAANTPGVTAPNTGDVTMDSASIAITKSQHVAVRWNGEETMGLTNAGTFERIMQSRFEQAFRALTNEIEADLAGAYKYASRACGATNAVPFASAGVLTDVAAARRILDDNGAASTDLQLVLGSAAMANLRGVQSSLFKVSEAGSDQLLRQGMVDRLEGFALRNSAQVAMHVKGTGAATYNSDLVAGYNIGDKAIHVEAGTGTLVAGDVVTFAGDSNNYVVNTGFAGDGDMDLVLNKPGLRATLANDVTMTIGNVFRANLGFDRSAIVLATRLPAMPEGGDAADDKTTLVDPLTGLAFEVAVYRQYLQVHYQVRLAWGWAAVKPEHICLLMGQS